MTLAAYNARRRELTRLEHRGWLNHKRNILQAYSHWWTTSPEDRHVGGMIVMEISHAIRAYRRKHKFWECI